MKTDLSHIRTNLPNLRQELYSSHPLIETQSRLASKVVQVRDQTLHHILETWVCALRVNTVHILGDVFDSEVLQLGNGRFVRCGFSRGCHVGAERRGWVKFMEIDGWYYGRSFNLATQLTQCVVHKGEI